MEIKPLQHDDYLQIIPTLKELLIASYESSFDIAKELCSITVDTKIQELGDYLKIKKANLLGVFIQDTLVGFVWFYVHSYFSENRIHINHIVVDKNHRGQGIAKKLLSQVEKYADDMNVKTIDLFVSEGNLDAVKMYENQGYVTERRYMKKNILGIPND